MQFHIFLNHKLILKILAGLLVFLSLSMIIPMILAFLWEGGAGITPFLIPAIPMLIVGIWGLAAMKPVNSALRIREGFFLAGACWLLASLLGAVPYWLAGVAGPADGFFESVSGFTTTGASVLTGLEVLSPSLLFWRSFTGWLGGIGILCFSVSFFPGLNIGGSQILARESGISSLNQLNARAASSMATLGTVYGLLTFFATMLLRAGGLSWFDALIHAFGTVSTCGFSGYADGLNHFGSYYVEMIVCLFMILAAINFTVYGGAFRSRLRNPLVNAELLTYLIIIAASTLFVSLGLWLSQICDTTGEAFRSGIFQSVSMITTTGFTTGDYTRWPTACRMFLFLLMFVGGCSASAAGGVKVIRVVIFFKMVRRGIYRRLHPNAVTPLKINGKVLPPETTAAVTSYLFLYLILCLAGTLILALDTQDIIGAAGASVACIGNIGPGFEMLGTGVSFLSFTGVSKVFMSLLMIAGRLELFAFLLLLTPAFWNPDK